MRPVCKNTVFILAKISQLYDPTLVWFYCWLYIKSLLTLSFPIQADRSCTLMTYIENSCRVHYQDCHQVNRHALKGLWCHASNIHHGNITQRPQALNTSKCNAFSHAKTLRCAHYSSTLLPSVLDFELVVVFFYNMFFLGSKESPFL